MSFIAASIIAGAATLGGGIINGIASSNAANAQKDAANSANALQERMYNQTRADQQPWREAGANALSQMGDPSFQHDFSMADFQQDPGYQFRMQQGMDALQSSAAARGGLMSGNTLKGIADYSQGAASQEYQNAYNRFTNNQSQRFNRLASLAGLGQTASGQTAAAGQGYANQVGENTMNSANAQGAAGMSMAHNISGSLGGMGQNWMQMQMLNKMMPGTPAAPTPVPSYGLGAGGAYTGMEG